jgi:hypothetical protein
MCGGERLCSHPAPPALSGRDQPAVQRFSPIHNRPTKLSPAWPRLACDLRTRREVRAHSHLFARHYGRQAQGMAREDDTPSPEGQPSRQLFDMCRDSALCNAKRGFELAPIILLSSAVVPCGATRGRSLCFISLTHTHKPRDTVSTALWTIPLSLSYIIRNFFKAKK